MTEPQLKLWLRKQKPEACWSWHGGVDLQGYPLWRAASLTRQVWLWRHGPVPDGMLLRKVCGDRRCVNPAHHRLEERDRGAGWSKAAMERRRLAGEERKARERRNRIRVEGGVAYVSLGKWGEAVIDAGDVGLVEGRRWHGKRHGNTVYVVSESTKAERDAGVAKTIRMHALLMQPPTGRVVDHRDGDGLNNRRANLRICTHAQNVRNRRVGKNSPLGVKGVMRVGNRFRAQIMVGGKARKLGVFHTVKEAADAYDKAARDLHGEFARPNGVE